MWESLSVVSFFSISVFGNSDCHWRVDDGWLDLSPLEETIITLNYDNFRYDYSICSDALSCDYNDDNEFMVTQTRLGGHSKGHKNKCTYLAQWDDDIQPTIEPISMSDNWDTTMYVFDYINGERNDNCDTQSMGFVATYYCDNDTTLEATMTQISDCIYGMNIATLYACDTDRYTTTTAPKHSSMLSHGAIVTIIIVAVCLAALLICCFFALRYRDQRIEEAAMPLQYNVAGAADAPKRRRSSLMEGYPRADEQL